MPRIVSLADIAAAAAAHHHGEPLFVAFNRNAAASLAAGVDDPAPDDAEYYTGSEATAERRADRFARRHDSDSPAGWDHL